MDIVYEVYSGETSTGITLEGDQMYVYSSGTALQTVVNQDGSLTVYDFGVANDTYVNGYYDDDDLLVHGEMYVSGYGVASNTTVEGGALYLDGGEAHDTVLSDGGYCYVGNGGWANNITVNAGGYLDVDLSTATEITENGGYVYVVEDSKVSFAANTFSDVVLTEESSATVHAGTVAEGTCVYEGGKLEVYDGGIANDTDVQGGSIEVYEGGLVSGTSLTGYYDYDEDYDYGEWRRGRLYVDEDGIANDTTVGEHGSMYVDGTANGITVDGGIVTVYGTADDVVVNVGGYVEIYGAATAITENGGYVYAEDADEISFTANTFSDLELIGDLASVHAGTVAKNITVSGYYYDDEEFTGGGLDVYAGGVADSVTVEDGGLLWIAEGGKFTGTLNIYEGGEVCLKAESIFDFDISVASPDGAALVNDWLLVDDNGAFYTITTSETQAAGVYALADGAADFDACITINTVGGKTLGEIEVGGELETEKYIYSLGIAEDTLSLTVELADTEPPVKPVAKADVTKPTNKNVTVTATFSDDSAVREYSLDNKTWKSYTAGIVMKDNGNVYFRAADEAGNVSDVTTYKVANIDKVAPTKPTAKADITAKTGKDVTVTATFSADSVKKEYSLDNKTWQTYTKGVVFAANGTAYFRAADEAGNVSDVTTYSVTNIDPSMAPTGKPVSGETSADKPAAAYKAELDAAGLYTVTGKFDAVTKGSVTIYDGAKKVASGSIKKGVLTFKKDALLEKKSTYTVEIKNTDKKSAGAAFSWTLTAKELFTKGDNSDDTKEKAKTLAANSSANDWVGYGDAVDCWKLGVDARGGFYDLNLSGVQNNVKLTVYSAQNKKLKSVTASAKKSTVPLAGLCLANGSYAVVEAPKAAKAQNSDYKLTLTEKAVFTGVENNDWTQAEVLTEGATFTGVLTKAAGGDTVDYCDVSKIDSLTFDMTAGKTKVSFYGEDKKTVKVAVTVGGKEKKAASLTLTANNKTSGSFTIAAIDDAVKYLKIEASGKTLNGYSITKIA